MPRDPDSVLREWAQSARSWNDYPSQLLRCYAEWLRRASPDQWHEAANAWNWTYGSEPMYWIACQKDCDRATAVLLYYLSSPSYYLGFGNEPPESAREGHELVTTIRDRLARNDYRRSEIAFDPRHEFATEMRLAPISDEAGFPEVLEGRSVPRPNEWNDGFPDEVWRAARSREHAASMRAPRDGRALFEGAAHPAWSQALATLLFVVSRGSLLVMLALLVFTDTRLVNPLRLIRMVFLFSLLPALAGWLLAKAFRAKIELGDGILVVDSRARRMEVPVDSIDAALPTLPPGALSLHLRSGRQLPCVLEVDDAVQFADAVAASGSASPLRLALQAAIAPRRAGGRAKRPFWLTWLLRYPLFALVPTLPLFNLHQWVSYGGTFGEYYMYGLKAYLLAFAVYWAHTTIWLLLLDTALAALAALIVFSSSLASPSAAAVIAGVAGRARNSLYYGAVALFLLRLYLQSGS